ncbi:MAG: hypothetical protein HY812_19355 [Planctomycetes bacterium]|nr:hypothetical protein [Planctomycetota bacterium]
MAVVWWLIGGAALFALLAFAARAPRWLRLERFTDPSRRVMVLAKEEALRRGHEQVGTGHVLLALLRTRDAGAVRVLEDLGLDRRRCRAEVEARLPVGAHRAAGRALPLSPRLKAALEGTRAEAVRLRRARIATEDLLIGLLAEGGGAAAAALAALGVTLEKARAALCRRPAALLAPVFDNLREWLDEGACAVLALARDEAERLGHDRIDTEHLLLGLARHDDAATRNLLLLLHLDPHRLAAEAESVAATSESGPPFEALEPFPPAPGARKAIDLALEEAAGLGQERAGPGHLLLGLLAERDGIAARVLLRSGLELEVARIVLERFFGPEASG